jgi:hypothetical protein
MKERLDIFEVLREINNKNYNYLDTIDDNLKKSFTPYVVFQWLQSTDDSNQVLVLNHISPMLFDLQDHPELLFKLFCISSMNKYTRYSWIFPKSTKDDTLEILGKYLECSKRVATEYKEFYTIDDIKKMAQELGYQDAEIKKLKL